MAMVRSRRRRALEGAYLGRGQYQYKLEAPEPQKPVVFVSGGFSGAAEQQQQDGEQDLEKRLAALEQRERHLLQLMRQQQQQQQQDHTGQAEEVLSKQRCACSDVQAQWLGQRIRDYAQPPQLMRQQQQQQQHAGQAEEGPSKRACSDVQAQWLGQRIRDYAQPPQASKTYEQQLDRNLAPPRAPLFLVRPLEAPASALEMPTQQHPQQQGVASREAAIQGTPISLPPTTLSVRALKQQQQQQRQQQLLHQTTAAPPASLPPPAVRSSTHPDLFAAPLPPPPPSLPLPPPPPLPDANAAQFTTVSLPPPPCPTSMQPEALPLPPPLPPPPPHTNSMPGEPQLPPPPPLPFLPPTHQQPPLGFSSGHLAGPLPDVSLKRPLTKNGRKAARKKANKRAREQGFKELGAEALAAAEAVQHTFAGFEEHTTGIGSKLMEKMGWRSGEGLGQRAQGRSEPVIPKLVKGKSGLGAT